MTPFDRFTRGRMSQVLWGGLTVAFAIPVAFAANGSRRNLAELESSAQARAERDTASTLASPNGSRPEGDLRARLARTAAPKKRAESSESGS